MTNNPTAQYDFAGASFTALNLDIRQPQNVNQGAITNRAFTQRLSDILFNNATGAISFAVAENPDRVRAITFTGNAVTINGFAVFFTGTWQGQLIPIIKAEKAAERESEGPALLVEGYWSAALANQIQ